MTSAGQFGMYGPPHCRKRKMKVTGWSAQMYTDPGCSLAKAADHPLTNPPGTKAGSTNDWMGIIGEIRAISCASCPARLGRSVVARPSDFAAFADGGLQVCIGVSRFRVIQQVATGLDVFRFIHLCESLLNVLPHAINLCGIKVAQFNWKLGAAGDNVDRSGGNLDVSHVAHLAALFSPYHVANSKHVL